MSFALQNNSNPGGIYVHIPFCVRKCPYCDFYSTTALDLIPRYLDALELEIRMASRRDIVFDSIYLGGGTPSVLAPNQIQRILKALFGAYSFAGDIEANIEVNPGTVDVDKLAAYRNEGLNRMTIGVQSFDDRYLKYLGRIHSAEEASQSIADARRAGFDHIGLDLIYGLPDQSRRQWAKDMNTAVSFGPEHLSCYMLSFEQGTPLHHDLQHARAAPVDEKTGAELFRSTVEFLADRGYRQYEVSNFALIVEGNDTINRSRHNQKYWTSAPYIGFGPGAHSYLEPRRYWNLSNLKGYLAEIEAGNAPPAESEDLSGSQMAMEAVLLGLRRTDGIDLIGFKDRFGSGFDRYFPGQIEELLSEGMAEKIDDRLALTADGMLLLDSICARLIQALRIKKGDL